MDVPFQADHICYGGSICQVLWVQMVLTEMVPSVRVVSLPVRQNYSKKKKRLERIIISHVI